MGLQKYSKCANEIEIKTPKTFAAYHKKTTNENENEKDEKKENKVDE